MAVNISPAMRKHYMSMFRKYKARVRAIDNAGLDLDIVNTSTARLESIGIDPLQKTLSLEDIAKLSHGTILESFLDNKLSTAKGRAKVIKEISGKVADKYDTLDSGTVSQIANFLTTSSYSVAVSLGILNSDQIADIFEDLDDGLEDIDVQSALDETINEFLRGEVKLKGIYQSIMDKLANMY